jgi:predicted dehydrogenase
MRKLRVGVVGAGFSGLSHMRALRQLPQVEIVAVTDLSPEQAQAAAEQVGVTTCFDDYNAMLEDVTPDAIHNCTPNHAHAEVTLAALERGVHVLSEKPLGMDSRETRSLVEAAKGSGAVTGVCFNYRYYPLVRELKATLESGTAGSPHLIHGSYLQDWLLLETDWNWRLESHMSGPSRAVADIGSHWIDLVQFATGEAVDEVTALLGRLHAQRLRPAQQTATFASSEHADRQPVAIDTEDFGCVLVKFASGCMGTMTVSQVSAGRKNSLAFEVDARDAAFSWNQENPNVLWIGHRGKPNELVLRDPSLMTEANAAFSRLPAGHPEGWLDTLVGLFTDFYRAILARNEGSPYRPSFASFADAHRIELIMEAVLASDRTGRPMKVGENP